MPAIIPAIAGWAAGTFAVTAIGVTAWTAVGVGLLAGALAGAVVGGIQAAIMGGDIGDGMLYGAVGGAVGGALGGYMAPEAFSIGSAGTNITTSNSFIMPGAAGTAGPTTAGFGIPVGQGVAGGTASSPGLLAGMGETSKLMLAQGGIQAMGGLFGGDGETYDKSEAGVTQQITSNENQLQTKVEADLKASQMAIDQRQREALLADTQAKDALGYKYTELDKTIAQRQSELQTPYDEAAAARERARQTATTLTLSRQQREAAYG